MPEAGSLTMEATAVYEVEQLFEAYKCEHKTSTLTLLQFRQIYAMRQQQKTPKDTSHIAVDYNSMHKKPDAAAHEAAAESRALEARKVEMKLHLKRKAALLMAKLHERIPAEQQQQLMGWCKSALREQPPSLTIPELANHIMNLCEQHLREDASGIELECDLRELFAELLEIPLDSFNSNSGGIPRRLFAAMLSRHRKKNAEISKQHAIPEDEEGEEDALGRRASGATRGFSSGAEDLRPVPDETEYLRRLQMLEKIPADKLDKFMSVARF